MNGRPSLICDFVLGFLLCLLYVIIVVSTYIFIVSKLAPISIHTFRLRNLFRKILNEQISRRVSIQEFLACWTLRNFSLKRVRVCYLYVRFYTLQEPKTKPFTTAKERFSNVSCKWIWYCLYLSLILSFRFYCVLKYFEEESKLSHHFRPPFSLP